MKPVDVNRKNEKHLLQTVYNHIQISGKAKLKVGDFVRICKYKNSFAKGYEANCTTEPHYIQICGFA